VAIALARRHPDIAALVMSIIESVPALANEDLSRAARQLLYYIIGCRSSKGFLVSAFPHSPVNEVMEGLPLLGVVKPIPYRDDLVSLVIQRYWRTHMTEFSDPFSIFCAPSCSC
jgi:hypothetical protein